MKPSRSSIAVVWAVALTILTTMPVFLLGALANQIVQAVHTTPAAIGLAVGSYWIGAAVSSSCTPALSRRISRNNLGYLAIVGGTASLIGSAAWMPTWHWLVAWAFVGGVGNGWGHPASNDRIVAAASPSRLGLLFGIKQASVPFCGVLAGLLVPITALTIGWQWAFAQMATIGAVLLLASFRKVFRSRVAPQARSADSPRPRLPRAIKRELVIVMSMTTLAAGACNSVLAFAVTGAGERGIGDGAAGTILAAVGLGGAVTRFVLGALVDRFGIRPLRMVTVVLVVCTAGFATMLLPSAWTYVLGLFLAGGVGAAWAGLIHLSVARLAETATAAGTGLVQTGSYIGSATGPVIAGTLITVGSTQAAWAALGGMSALAVVLSVVVNVRLNRLGRTRSYAE
ncbi:hypothetical protein CH267_13210 [Rhodococcus sp. 06-621-2]|nr:MFS transporter [Rhodococcus sp. 06-621-2]OZC55527.1 hypothetical protein CH267_13210 [Rhodococcus sp. 06-621-2]